MWRRLTNPQPLTYFPKTLRSELQRRGRLPCDECLALATALDHLHRHGLMHRDIKPSNIVFVNGIPKLADIGLVTHVEATLSFVDTEGYLPPEGPGTPQADIYSLGKYSTKWPRAATARIIAALDELNEVIVKACHADAKQRYQTAAELHADLALFHVDHIFAARFAPDGSRVATCSPDQTIKLWRVTTGQLLNTFKGQADEGFDLAYSPDGRFLALVGVNDGSLKLWDATAKPRPAFFRESQQLVGFDASGALMALDEKWRPVTIDPATLQSRNAPKLSLGGRAKLLAFPRKPVARRPNLGVVGHRRNDEWRCGIWRSRSNFARRVSSTLGPLRTQTSVVDHRHQQRNDDHLATADRRA